MTDHNEYWQNPKDTQLGKWQKELESVSGSSTFCILPWIHFATRPNGDMRLCCSANASGAGEDHEVGLVKMEDGKLYESISVMDESDIYINSALTKAFNHK